MHLRSTRLHERACDVAGVRVDATAPGADSDAAGLLQIRISADDAAAAPAVVALAAGAVKGALPGGDTPPDAPVSAQLCHLRH